MKLSTEYKGLFSSVIDRVRLAQYEAFKVVNKELVGLYWDIGQMIVKLRKLKDRGSS